MRLAIIAVTSKGANLADQLAQSLKLDVTVYAKQGRTTNRLHHTYEKVSTVIDEIFAVYDGLIFIMATGIVVRVIAPHITDKRFDPAVVVLDDMGKHAISLLSGHLGGANELTLTVAKAIDAVPVITTASDTAQKVAADTLAVKLNLAIEPFDQLKVLNASIVNEDRVLFCLDGQLPEAATYHRLAEEMGVNLETMDRLGDTDSYDSAVVITDKDLYMTKPHVYLRPATLFVGIGCRRGTSSAMIYEALTQSCKKIGRSMKSIAALATVDIKKDEIGLLSASQQLALPVKYYNSKTLQACVNQYKLTESDFVKEQIGVGNVCEAAAILGGKSHKLLLPKTKYQKVTIAISEVNSLLSE
ncbi:MAG: cobalt-precorrin 5A hydrolase [Sporomusaceae bacterium]|nr:cobalt-precorrin 5A hydrolase [Sporomusaceae bacterium]